MGIELRACRFNEILAVEFDQQIPVTLRSEPRNAYISVFSVDEICLVVQRIKEHRRGIFADGYYLTVLLGVSLKLQKQIGFSSAYTDQLSVPELNERGGEAGYRAGVGVGYIFKIGKIEEEYGIVYYSLGDFGRGANVGAVAVESCGGA